MTVFNAHLLKAIKAIHAPLAILLFLCKSTQSSNPASASQPILITV
jgi:hypothetical protein